MGGIGVISNPRSGRNQRNPELVERLAWMLGEKGELAQPKSFDMLDACARDLRDRQVDVVCVHGGDGTLHKALSALFRAYAEDHEGPLEDLVLPRIAILKAGTMNTQARNVGVKRKAEPMLGHVVRTWQHDQPFAIEERRMLVVDGKHCGFLFGTGVLARFLEAYYEGDDASPSKAVRTLLRAIWGALTRNSFDAWLFRPDPYEVVVDGKAWAGPAYASVCAGTMADLGLGFQLFHRALANREHLHAIGATCSAWEIVKLLPRIYRGLPIGRPGIYDQAARRMEIRVAEGAEPVIPYMIDGDFLRGEGALTVEVGPRVRFIVG